ncbi:MULTISPECIES: alpha/beta fold hydrolase [unclassified Paenibacillus]|uniref:alpha/beta fold hydrolase n=1 Tax=unclassified Paenibacillus TaxID=185978 RepID=UPI0036337285
MPELQKSSSDDANRFIDITVKTREGDIHLIASGNEAGRPVLFMHGITEYARSFVPVMKLLPASYYAVSMDLRGRGESFKPESGYWLQDYMADLLSVWNLFSGFSGSPILVGHSLSGRIAAAFAAQYPELVGTLILIDPPISGPGRREFPMPLSRFTGPKVALEKGNMEEFAAFYANTRLDTGVKAEELKLCSLQSIEQSYNSIMYEPFHSYYRLIRSRTLLLAAGLSPLITEEELDELKRMNPVVLTKRIVGIGHEIFKEDPKLFVDELLRFVEGDKKV